MGIPMILEPKAIGLERLERMRAKHHVRASKAIGIKGFTDHGVVVAPNEKAGDIIRAVATTNYTDLDEEVLLPGGADMTYIEANRKIFADHWYDTEHAVGKVKTLTITAQGIILDARMLTGPEHPMAAAVTSMARQIGIGVSVGFDPTNWGDPTAEEKRRYPNAKCIIREYRLLEVSFTPMPCNVSCQSLAVTADDSLAAPVKRLSLDLRRRLKLLPMLSLR